MSQNVYENIIKILKDGNYNYEEINHNEVKTTEESKEERKKPVKKSGFMERLEKMQREQEKRLKERK